MESPALVAIVAACVGAAAMLLVVATTTPGRRRSRADLEARVAAAERECEDLRRRLVEVTARRTAEPDRAPTPTPARTPAGQPADFVITHVGDRGDSVVRVPTPVPDRLVLSATLGEPLVKVAAFSHGVRRALSAESRNRIWFEMRREVRASRRRRRELRKRLEREYRANLRAAEDLV